MWTLHVTLAENAVGFGESLRRRRAAKLTLATTVNRRVSASPNG